MTPTAADQHGLLRAAVLAAFSAVLTAVGHLVGGGRSPTSPCWWCCCRCSRPGSPPCPRAPAARWARSGCSARAARPARADRTAQPDAPVHAAHHLAGPATPNGIGMLAGHVAGHPAHRGRAVLRRPRHRGRRGRAAPGAAAPTARAARRPPADHPDHPRPGGLAAPRARPGRHPGPARPSGGVLTRTRTPPHLPEHPRVLVNPSTCAARRCPVHRHRRRAARRRHSGTGPRHRPTRPGRAGRLRGHRAARTHRIRHGRHGETAGHPADRHADQLGPHHAPAGLDRDRQHGPAEPAGSNATAAP